MSERPYQILPFRYERLSEDAVLLTNEAGEFSFVAPAVFDDLTNNKLSINSESFQSLKAKQIVTDTDLKPVIEMLATKYRTKKGFLKDFTSLHMVVPTLRCNSRCIYCQVSSRAPDAKNCSMDKLTATKTVDLIFQTPSPVVKIEFQGGEPLLNFEIVRFVIDYAEKANKKSGKALQFVVCSNLTLLNREHPSFFKDHNVFLSTSLDGPKEIHDKNRPLRDGGSAYEILLNSLEAGRKILGNSCISALTTITRNNLHHLKGVIDEYVKQGFSSIFLRPLNPFGLAKKNQLVGSYAVQDFVKEYKAALEYIITLNLSGVYFVEEYTLMLLQKVLTPFSTGFVDLQSPAGLGISAVLYNHDGNVYPSDEARMLAEAGDQKFLLGNVHKNNFRELFNGNGLKDLTRWSILESLPICSSCAFCPYCGLDPVRNYAATGDPVGGYFLNDFCKMNYQIMKHLFSLIWQNDPKIMDVFWSWLTKRSLKDVSITDN